jgi:predicted enzyme related to lactoylglutathione lyase
VGQPVTHFEIGCKDQTKTSDFYSRLFDWNIQQMGPAAMIDTGSQEGIQGHITALGHEPHNYTAFYVHMDDIAAYLEKAKVLGGRPIVGPIDIPTGSFAWFADPEGNTIGLFQQKA